MNRIELHYVPINLEANKLLFFYEPVVSSPGTKASLSSSAYLVLWTASLSCECQGRPAISYLVCRDAVFYFVGFTLW